MCLSCRYDGVFEVLATAGDTDLGGEDFDNRLMDHFIKAYKTKTGTDMLQNQRALGKLKREVEKVKRTLSSQMSTKLEIESFENGKGFSVLKTMLSFRSIMTHVVVRLFLIILLLPTRRFVYFVVSLLFAFLYLRS